MATEGELLEHQHMRIKSLEAECLQTQTENERLYAEVNRLQDEMLKTFADEKVPKTEDGVPAVPGMEVWFDISHATIRKVCDGGEYGFTVEVEDAEGPQGWVPLSKCYSTLDACCPRRGTGER